MESQFQIFTSGRNCRPTISSLRNKICEIEALLTDKNFKMLSMNEHWLSEFELNVLNILNFHVVSSFFRKNIKGGGSIILT